MSFRCQLVGVRNTMTADSKGNAMSRDCPKTIIVDFDGTLCKFAFPDVGEYEPGAREALWILKNRGYKIVIHSVRTATYWGMEPQAGHIKVIETFLKDNSIPYDEILLSCDKPIAAAYIDDRGVNHSGDWGETLKNTLSVLGTDG